MFHVPLPQPPQITSQKDNKTTFVIEGLYPGYGLTIANALRRIILSSLPGAAVVAVKIKDIDHEFSTIPGVLEDVVVILLHIKKMRFLVHEEGLFEGHINVKGEKEVKAGDFTFPSQIELVNPDLHIASLTDKKAELEISVWITRGTGYQVREKHEERDLPKDIGVLTIDSLFSPITSVSFNVENMRVGEKTNYNRVILTIETDGTISAQDAYEHSSQVLVDQFQAVSQLERKSKAVKKEPVKSPKKEANEEIKEAKTTQIDQSLSGRFFITNLKLSSRIEKILKRHRVKTIAQLMQKSEANLLRIDGIGDSAVKEIRRKLGKAGFILGNK